MAATDRSEGSEPTRTASSSMLGKRKHSSQTGVFCLHLEMWNHEVGQDIGRKYAVMLPVEATMLRMAERASANRRLHPLSQNGNLELVTPEQIPRESLEHFPPRTGSVGDDTHSAFGYGTSSDARPPVSR